MSPSVWERAPKRFTLTDAPAPTSKPLEQLYYHDVNAIYLSIKHTMENKFEKAL